MQPNDTSVRSGPPGELHAIAALVPALAIRAHLLGKVFASFETLISLGLRADWGEVQEVAKGFRAYLTLDERQKSDAWRKSTSIARDRLEALCRQVGDQRSDDWISDARALHATLVHLERVLDELPYLSDPLRVSETIHRGLNLTNALELRTVAQGEAAAHAPVVHEAPTAIAAPETSGALPKDSQILRVEVVTESPTVQDVEKAINFVTVLHEVVAIRQGLALTEAPMIACRVSFRPIALDMLATSRLVPEIKRLIALVKRTPPDKVVDTLCFELHLSGLKRERKLTASQVDFYLDKLDTSYDVVTQHEIRLDGAPLEVAEAPGHVTIVRTERGAVEHPPR